jgi:hypothetical protein
MATVESSTFRLAYGVKRDIPAPLTQVWNRLTDAADFARWNSTVTTIEGTIALGEKLAITVPISSRVFRPRVVELEPEHHMVWQDGAAPMFRGRRTFSLVATSDTETEFSMVEEFRGVMLPLIARSLPDFAPVFDQYADDLIASFRH